MIKHCLRYTLILLSFFSLCIGEEFRGIWTNKFETVVASKGPQLKIGVISAKPYEQGNLLSFMQNVKEEHHGSRTYYNGSLFGIDTVLTLSRVGKVASAATATELIAGQKVDVIVFIGTAGAIDEKLKRGDVVIANSLVQYDMDATPFVPLFTIPMLRVREFYPDKYLKDLTKNAAKDFVSFQLNQTVPQETLDEFMILNPAVYEGLIGTGDSFISKDERKRDLKEKLPELLCVEMEGAAVAQVAFEYDIPCLIIRIISDSADHTAYPDFQGFLEKISPAYAHGVLENLYEALHREVKGN